MLKIAQHQWNVDFDGQMYHHPLPHKANENLSHGDGGKNK